MVGTRIDPDYQDSNQAFSLRSPDAVTGTEFIQPRGVVKMNTKRALAHLLCAAMMFLALLAFIDPPQSLQPWSPTPMQKRVIKT